MSNKTFGDDRLKKSGNDAVRGSRAVGDYSRTQQDGTYLSAEERRSRLRAEYVQEVLPTPPDIPGFHTCWLSTTNGADPVFKRIQFGYTPVTREDVPGFNANTMKGGDFDGCLSCNEMLLFKLPLERYNDLMMLYHNDIPNEEEDYLRNNLVTSDKDSNGRSLGLIEGDGFSKLGNRPPSFG